ncbi:MAG: efflux RND transporter periplasmic adaptor subunit [Deltaproteobacteria bacterium]|nr:efflux RND transporter periplasmic adaptor subunit [Deltaproteobacteria bacterium]
MKKKIAGAAFLAFFIAVALLVYWGQKKKATEELYYSGSIEATQAELSFQAAGKVASVAGREGAFVKSGEILAWLDPAEFLARRDQSAALLTSAEKNILRLESLLELYKKALPADVARARAAIDSSRAALEEARSDKERYDALMERKVVSRREWERVNLKYNTTAAQYAEAQAVLRQAEGNLEKIESARREIDGAKAQRAAAMATLHIADINLGYAKLAAPLDGIITSRHIEPGEVVTPGQKVLTVADLAIVELKIFVGEEEIGKVHPGQKVDVGIDTFPDKKYQGTVSFISPEAEFTPKIIQTQKERVKLVYLVKVTIPNPNYEMKPGMPADAWLR